MVVYKKYGMKVYRRFLHTNFNSDFGVDKEKFINKLYGVCAAESGNIIHRMGITLEDWKKNYIPIISNHLGKGAYVMFMCICANEGGAGTNSYINNKNSPHTNPRDILLDDVKTIKNGINSFNLPVCRSAHEVLGGTPYIPDKNNNDIKMLNSCKKGTVGRYYIPFTMAGNSWIFATKWTLAHQGPVPNCYFGNPYDSCIDYIKSCGGKINGSGGSPSNSNSNNKEDNAKISAEDIVENIERALRFDIHNIAMTNYYENAFISMERTYNNTYKLRFRHDFLENIVKNAISNTDDHDKDNNISDDFQDSSISAGKWWFPVKKNLGLSDPWGHRAWRQNARNPTGFHDGIDIGNNSQIYEHKIYACHSGTVIYSNYMMSELMWVIIIKTGKYYIWYQEFTSTANNVAVKVGDKVKAKQYIGYVTGTHVHVGITKQKDINQALASAFTNNGTWLNPMKFFKNKYWG